MKKLSTAAVFVLLAACSSNEETADNAAADAAATAPLPAPRPEGQPTVTSVSEVPLGGVTVRTNEPFYMAAIGDEDIVLHQPDTEQTTHYRRAETAAEGDTGRRYAGVAADGRRIELLVTLEPCIDSMSGAQFPMSGKLWVDEVEALGCASLSD